MLPDEAITPEILIKEGRAWANRLLSALPPEERLKGLDVKDIEKYLESLKNKN